MKTWQRLTVVAGSIILALAAGTGIALATIPDSSGVIHGCYKAQSDGHAAALSVIDTALTGGHCPTGNTALNWNQTGPQGPQGATGAQGPAGPAGPPGISGYQIVTAAPQSGGFSAIGATAVATMQCPAGEMAISGGGTAHDASGNVLQAIAESAPSADGTAWITTFWRPPSGGGNNTDDLGYAVCANVSP